MYNSLPWDPKSVAVVDTSRCSVVKYTYKIEIGLFFNGDCCTQVVAIQRPLGQVRSGTFVSYFSLTLEENTTVYFGFLF